MSVVSVRIGQRVGRVTAAESNFTDSASVLGRSRCCGHVPSLSVRVTSRNSCLYSVCHWRFERFFVGCHGAARSQGVPFPLVLRSLGQTHGEPLPWAWAVNGCATVMAGPFRHWWHWVPGPACYLLAALNVGTWQGGCPTAVSSVGSTHGAAASRSLWSLSRSRRTSHPHPCVFDTRGLSQ